MIEIRNKRMTVDRIDFISYKSISTCMTKIVWVLLIVFATRSIIVGDDRPNVLWIIADDLSPDLGSYGYKGVHTPNIDRLAEFGAQYTNAFATAPVCSSSRSAFITGVYQTTTGTHQHRTANKKSLPEPVEPITELLRRAGYFVCNSNSTMKRPGKGDYNFRFDGEMYDAADWSMGKNGRKKDQPFFAQVQIHEPHRDFSRSKNLDRAKTAKIPSYYPEHPVIRADWANYLQTIEDLDRNVGAVLDRLDGDGLAENTVVFLFGDHGRPHYRDKQWLYDGGIRVPLIVRWPNKIGSSEQRSELVSLIDVSAATLAVSGVSIPTWMNGQNMLAENFAGREMVFAARDRCGSTLDRIRSVRTQRFKYIRNFHPDRPYSQHSGYKELQYPGMTVGRVLKLRGGLSGPAELFWRDRRPDHELYDVLADPEELNNLAEDPTHTKILSDLRSELDRWIERTHDKGRASEANVEATASSSDLWFSGQMKKRGLNPKVDPETYLKWWERELGLK